MEDLLADKKLPTQNDFKFGKEIGCGSFSKVYEARELETERICAIKVVNKAHIFKNKAVNSVMMERYVLSNINSPYIIKLFCTFQDTERLYFCMELAQNSEIAKYLTNLSNFSVECTKFYGAEILSALNYLHEKSIVHRDLKPENTLLSDSWHVKLADFGSAIVINQESIKAESFTGTPQYVSPEMIDIKPVKNPEEAEENKKLMYLMDYWAFGCIIYHFLSGLPPFRFRPHETNEFVLFKRITNLDYEFVDMFDPTGRDLVKRLLVLDPKQRLGSPSNGGLQGLKTHEFFQGVNWDTLLDQVPPKLNSNLVPQHQEEIEKTDWEKIPNDYEKSQQYHMSLELNMSFSGTKDLDTLLKEQYKFNEYHKFTSNNLIIKQAVLFKRRGLFAKKRMFLLTQGAHLYYIDMDKMIRKGEIPFSVKMQIELKNERMFSIHTPGRIYYLENPKPDSSSWIEEISKVYKDKFKQDIQVISNN